MTYAPVKTITEFRERVIGRLKNGRIKVTQEELENFKELFPGNGSASTMYVLDGNLLVTK